MSQTEPTVILGSTLAGYFADMDTNGTNSTLMIDESPPQYIQDLKMANKVILTSLLAFIMVAMGCVITPDDLKRVLRRPFGVFIGFCSQFIVLPLSGFGLAHALSLKPGYALGVLVTVTCPGGVTSNLYTFWSNGDVCLSITMTAFSTIVAMGMMPLNLFIYSRSWTNDGAIIPYNSIIISLVLILVPVLIGMLIKYKKPSWCPIITKLGSIFGLLAIAINIILNGIINPSMFFSPWQLWFASFILPLLGYGFGYLLAFILRRPHIECRTICFETGAQNIGLALTLILVTFADGDLFQDMLVFPSLYGPFLILHACLIVVIYLIWQKWHGRQEQNDLPIKEKESQRDVTLEMLPVEPSKEGED
ncbi:ileal sodium/bile acid cotransporter-like [Asterias rubens]|uniref:ileal sodium/bile acid cotransporter-like n=1 Tax=Asterias rubens TaxID=7604 RepID=UPI00145530F8|nr:ileal sodium/bile acid cotransporter-like [Asterias rubens]XP_033626718.1 ileal sodium/bile acid cotransporter-like [Asterias rubens]